LLALKIINYRLENNKILLKLKEKKKEKKKGKNEE
jgi:hypothetical protein